MQRTRWACESISLPLIKGVKKTKNTELLVQGLVSTEFAIMVMRLFVLVLGIATIPLQSALPCSKDISEFIAKLSPDAKFEELKIKLKISPEQLFPDGFFQAHKGQKKSSNYPIENAEFRILGSGQFGTAIRVIPKNGAPPFIIKRYKPKNAVGMSPEDAIKNDLFGFRLLRGLKNSFRVVQATRDVEPRILRIENSEGKALNQVLDNNEVPTNVKRYLTDEYNRLAESAKDQLEANGFIPQTHSQTFAKKKYSLLKHDFIIDLDAETRYVSISPDNIVVNPKTLELILVDPY